MPIVSARDDVNDVDPQENVPTNCTYIFIGKSVGIQNRLVLFSRKLLLRSGCKGKKEIY